jgi:hypothetical protein
MVAYYYEDYECPRCETEFRYRKYHEGSCPNCQLTFELEDDVEGRCIPLWATDPRSSNYRASLMRGEPVSIGEAAKQALEQLFIKTTESTCCKCDQKANGCHVTEGETKYYCDVHFWEGIDGG